VIVAAASMFAAVFAFYARTATFSFVNFDDNDYVFNNEHVLSGLSVSGAQWAFSDTASTWNWHPLTWLSLMCDVSVSGVRAEPVGLGNPRFETPELSRISRVMHLHNALLHAANAALLLLLALGMAGRWDKDDREMARHDQNSAWGLIVAAGIVAAWAVHPLRAEVVCWVSERKELLSVFFMLLSLLVYFRWRGRGGLCAALLLFAFALMAKPVAVTLPVVFLAMDWMICNRVLWGRAIAAFSLSAAACVATIFAQNPGIAGLAKTSLAARFLNAVASVGVYLRQTVVPCGLSAMYPFSEGVGALDVAIGCAVLAAAAAVSVRWFRGARGQLDRAAFLSVAWAFVALLPMLGIVQVGEQAHADRYTYWAGCGLAVAVVMACRRFPNGQNNGIIGQGQQERRCWSGISKGAFKGLGGVLGGIGVMLLAWMGWRQCSTWRDTRAVYQQAWEATGSGWAAAAAAQAWKAVDPRESERIYRKAIEAHPNDAFLLSQFAVHLAVRASTRDFSEARTLAERALRNDPSCCHAHEALGFAAVRGGDFNAAEEHFVAAIRLGSDSPVVRRALEDALRGKARRPGPWLERGN
jgi:hypothetical protein